MAVKKTDNRFISRETWYIEVESKIPQANLKLSSLKKLWWKRRYSYSKSYSKSYSSFSFLPIWRFLNFRVFKFQPIWEFSYSNNNNDNYIASQPSTFHWSSASSAPPSAVSQILLGNLSKFWMRILPQDTLSRAIRSHYRLLSLSLENLVLLVRN